MSNDTLTQLRNELKYAAANLKKCQSAFKGLRAFQDNEQGLAFCAYQLLQEAAGLREHTEQIATIAHELHAMYNVVTQPEETLDPDLNLDEQQRRNGVSL
jgi:hypothetical protein